MLIVIVLSKRYLNIFISYCDVLKETNVLVISWRNLLCAKLMMGQTHDHNHKSSTTEKCVMASFRWC